MAIVPQNPQKSYLTMRTIKYNSADTKFAFVQGNRAVDKKRLEKAKREAGYTQRPSMQCSATFLPMPKTLFQNQAAILTQQKAEQIQSECVKICSNLFGATRKNADSDVIFSLPHNLNAKEEEKINALADGQVTFRLVNSNHLFFKFSDYGRTYHITGADAYNKICEKLLSVQSTINELRLSHEVFITEIEHFKPLCSAKDLLLLDNNQMNNICKKFFDLLFRNLEQLYYLPSLDAFNHVIKNVFGGIDFYPQVIIDQSSRVILQIHAKCDDNKRLSELTLKRIAVKKDMIVSHILKCWRLFCEIEMRRSKNNNINSKKTFVMNKKRKKIVEQGTASQSCNENGMNNYQVAKQIAAYLVQINNNGSELADFAKFCGVSTASFIKDKTQGAVFARVTEDAIVLEETSTGYVSAFMTRFIADSRLEERLVEEIARFINRAMSEVKPETSEVIITEVDDNSVIEDKESEDSARVIKDFNTTFAEKENEIINYISEVSDVKTRKIRLYTMTCNFLFDAGYKGDKHREKIRQ